MSRADGRWMELAEDHVQWWVLVLVMLQHWVPFSWIY